MKNFYDAKTRELKWTFAEIGVEPIVWQVPMIETDSGWPERDDAAFVNGWKQTIGDSAAKSRDTKTGKPETDAEKRAAMQSRVDLLATGEYSKKAGRAATLVDVEILVALMVEATGKSTEGVSKFVQGLDEPGRKKWTEDDRFKVDYATRLAAKKPSKPMDVTLQSELDKVE